VGAGEKEGVLREVEVGEAMSGGKPAGRADGGFRGELGAGGNGKS